jgi:hypothetical protein
MKAHRVTGFLDFFYRPVFFGVETPDDGKSQKNPITLCVIQYRQNRIKSSYERIAGIKKKVEEMERKKEIKK